jgi:hypothetical protein
VQPRHDPGRAHPESRPVTLHERTGKLAPQCWHEDTPRRPTTPPSSAAAEILAAWRQSPAARPPRRAAVGAPLSPTSPPSAGPSPYVRSSKRPSRRCRGRGTTEPLRQPGRPDARRGGAPIPTTGDYLNQYMAHQAVSQPTSDAAALIGQYCGSSIAQSERFPDPEPLSCRPLDPQCRSWP